MTLVLLPHTAQANGAYDKYVSLCNQQIQPKINVVPSTKPVKYDYSRTIADLQKTQSDTVNPYSYHAVTHVQGLMEGSIRLRQDVKIEHKQLPRYGGICLWYDCLLYTSPSPRDRTRSRMPSSA